MKRVYLILTLFMTSFFLLSSNVSADVIDIEISESNYNKINDIFFTLREKSIEYANLNNKHYIIIYSNSQYYSYMFDKESFESLNPSFLYTSNMVKFNINISFETCYYNTSSDSIFCNGSGTAYKDILINSSYNINYLTFLDSSYNNFIYSGSATKAYPDFILKYDSISYEIKKNIKIPTLYEIYQDYQLSQVDPKAEIVTNFYVLIIDKIKLLTNYIATDYIILSALVIFIFVAVIGLVRRLK